MRSSRTFWRAPTSLPSREAWIEIKTDIALDYTSKSLPSREAWIEIINLEKGQLSESSLPSREAWIEIIYHLIHLVVQLGRFPRGKRGLKYKGFRRLYF